MRRFIEYMAATWTAFGAAFMLLDVLGQALTGGVRIEAREEPEMLVAWQAVFLLVWLVAATYTGAKSALRLLK